jgi:lysyl-tRNA synthetase, class II
MLYPARSTVLCKRYRGEPLPNSHELIERFESYAVGMELCNAYSELNDPEIQRLLIEEQAEARAAGHEEAMPHNELFVRSLEYGSPPVEVLALALIGWSC